MYGDKIHTDIATTILYITSLHRLQWRGDGLASSGGDSYLFTFFSVFVFDSTWFAKTAHINIKRED